MQLEFAGKVAVVTGASRGIGLGVARLFAARGASIIAVARDRIALESAVQSLPQEQGQSHRVVVGDANGTDTAEHAVATAVDVCGRLDILANIAGWYPTALVEQTSDADFEQTMAANIGATFRMCRAAAGELGRSGGAIVNMSSTAARFPTPGLAAYSASKAAVEAFTRSLAAELAPAVRVNAVAAGPTLTESVRDLIASDTTGAVRAVTQSLPLGRLAQVDEIAEAVLFLASPRAAVFTGQVLYANCGGHMA
ncbi:SDR family oxidoreductase [Novosphingobium sp. KCTC 2891]|uniref:SDR family NAD(P)-dependent oxidoreductase n=1 Tax=Novosphingobium sp. KCTC 2891 TaxID=2989730 RepID=UPI00222174F2|nr:SDR family NAD(P)-dependent oxidoreductase [Novosphingobium sp. KCTC 2891]MCW1384925.1 SDR family oxidoreductase [Novosphingobium sp. KCTC 2891]